MRPSRSLQIRFTAALMLFVSWSAAGSQTVDGSVSWLPLAELKLAGNGDLVGWQVNGLGVDPEEILDAEQSLLVLQVFVGNNDASDDIVWRRISPRPGYLGEFVGTISDLALEIRRTYKPGNFPGTLVHTVQMMSRTEVTLDDIKLVLDVKPKLRLHRPNDGSLGDVFYSYQRTFVATKPSKKFERVIQKQQGVSFALATRHVAVIVSPESLDKTQLLVNSKSEAILTADISGFPFEQGQILAAIRLTGSDLGGGRHRDLMYADMLSPMKALARAIEFSLQKLTNVLNNVGVALVIFAFLVRILMFPLSLWSARQQQSFTEVQKQMKPRIERINDELRGAAKNEEIIRLYKEFGVSPFSGLKGSTALLIQLPILIALFAVTTESAIFRDASFLWAADISLPDRAVRLPFTLPGLGGYLNILPVVLGIISIFSAYFQSRSAGVRHIPRAGLLLALAFVVFFYSCAAALVVYWIVVNISQIFESLFVRWRYSGDDTDLRTEVISSEQG